jgi:hypothetical protein
MKNILSITTLIILIAVLFVVVSDRKEVQPIEGLGSVARSGEYHATSTGASNVYGAFTGDTLIQTGAGTLGSVVITGANTGVVNFYNATTSNVLARTGQRASSTLLMASIPASTVAGTYTFDVSYTDGLLLELESGLAPTTTITYR